MRRPSWQSRWWVLALFNGAIFGVLSVLQHLVIGDASLLGAVVGGVFGGVVFGLLMGVITARLNRRMVGEVGDVAVGDQRAVSRAAVRGPVPQDPAVRQAALRMAVFQAARGRRMRWFAVAVFGGLIALSVYLAAAQTPMWLLGAVFFAALLVWVLVQPLWFDRRADLLQHA